MRSVLLVVGTCLVGTQAFLPCPPLARQSAARVVVPSFQTSKKAPLQVSSLFEQENTTAKRIREGLLVRFLPEDIKRVLDSWDRMVANKPFEDKAAQRFAESYVEGLSAKPWHDLARYVDMALIADLSCL